MNINHTINEFAGIETELTSRALPNRVLSDYIKSCVRQMKTLTDCFI